MRRWFQNTEYPNHHFVFNSVPVLFFRMQNGISFSAWIFEQLYEFVGINVLESKSIISLNQTNLPILLHEMMDFIKTFRNFDFFPVEFKICSVLLLRVICTRFLIEKNHYHDTKYNFHIHVYDYHINMFQIVTMY